ncbi:His Kinase A domain containing protein [Tulasnella sp. JGI-2019a]|nr:His Kinase A domain containing protein [Tulasnella sp. JGI-2019a]
MAVSSVPKSEEPDSLASPKPIQVQQDDSSNTRMTVSNSRPPLLTADTGTSGSSSTRTLRNTSRSRSPIGAPPSSSVRTTARKPIRKAQRPSTAPAPEDAGRPHLLPSRPSATRVQLQSSSSSSSSRLGVDEKQAVYGYSITRGRSPGEKQPPTPTQQGFRSASAISAAITEFAKTMEDTVMDGDDAILDAAAPLLITPPNLPALSSSSQLASNDDSGVEAQGDADDATAEPCDWNAFTRAYALGQWDPYRTPLPPRSSKLSVPLGTSSSPLKRISVRDSSPGPSSSEDPLPQRSSETRLSSYAPDSNDHFSRSTASGSGALSPSIPMLRGRSMGQLELEHVDMVDGGTFSDEGPMMEEGSSNPTVSSHGRAKAAATVRWASLGVQVAPLALPLPEYELMDPMRAVIGSSSSGLTRGPSGSRKGASGRTRLDTIRASPLTSPNLSHTLVESTELLSLGGGGGGGGGGSPPTPMSKRRSRENSAAGSFVVGPHVSASLTPFTSPSIRHANRFPPPSPVVTSARKERRSEDYFAKSHSASKNRSGAESAPHSTTQFGDGDNIMTNDVDVDVESVTPTRQNHTPEPRQDGNMLPPMEKSTTTKRREKVGDAGWTLDMSSSPAIETFLNPNAVCGTTAGSRMVGASFHDLSTTATSTTTVTPPVMMAVMSPEEPNEYVIPQSQSAAPSSESNEESFAKLGYLVPPLPPDERGRMQALQRYGILHTVPDVNFDRISHMARLVFNAKMVLITLIDGEKQWHKAEICVGLDELHRRNSFCGHTILQRGDEPMVILDASKDWRFKKNPLVTGHPHIRFYAGAPLRTAEGYNLGALCLLDDTPRTDFSPRSRHTLKEFAAIVMRELELWRDKIHLRVRDRIQKSMEVLTRECLERDEVKSPGEDENSADVNMRRVYQHAAEVLKETLDVDGAIVLDVSHFEVMEGLGDSDEGGRGPPEYYHANLYDLTNNSSTNGALSSDAENPPGERSREFGAIPPLPVLGSAEEPANINPLRSRQLNGDDHAKLSKFLTTYTDGKIYECLPSCFRNIIPANAHYTMIVPVFNVDRRPFLLLCAYTLYGTQHYMEGYELQFLRAVGVIILSAVLKRRMALADTAKSLFISNISHELRTPLHGILASAELLHDTALTNTQLSYLKTVQTCATSLVETVNHVLDFTKLSGNTNDGGQQPPIKLTKLDLKCLIDEIVESCWLGARARETVRTEEIGSVYAPPKGRRSSDGMQNTTPALLVETVIDISHRPEGWWVMSDAGGIRRILMNLISNSIKFTTDGFIHVRLRELPHEPKPGTTTIEIAVYDSGKGISKDFLQNRMFQPFSQENPLQTGTGLGLAIVNSIGTSLGGKVEVWSAEGVGTEIRLVTDVNVVAKSEPVRRIVDASQPVTVSLIGFDTDHKGTVLLRETMNSYLVNWWGFTISEDQDGIYGDILLVNEDAAVIEELIAGREFMRPVVLLSAARGDAQVVAAMNMFEQLGGWCRLVFKPSGPVRLGDAFTTAVSKLDVMRGSPASSASGSYHSIEGRLPDEGYFGIPFASTFRGPLPVKSSLLSSINRRRSADHHEQEFRPMMVHQNSAFATPTPRTGLLAALTNDTGSPRQLYSHPSNSVSTLDLGEDGSVMLKSVVGSTDANRKPIVLIVDDNVVNRNLLAHWLNKRGCEFQQASDGQEAVDIFSQFPPGHFDGQWCWNDMGPITNLASPVVILMDLSMPHKNGFEASQEIRRIERMRQLNGMPSDIAGTHSKLFALTGLASIEDKRKAFAAGVDGYLIKPVSLKTLEGVFRRLKNG